MSKIKLERQGSVVVLKLDDPATLNSMDSIMCADMAEALRQIDHDPGARCLTLTGEGESFCSGANLGGAGEGQSEPATSVLRNHFHPLLLSLKNLSIPFITAVNGPCAGVGMSFALAGDLTYMARSAYFLQAFARVGLVPDGGSTWMLPRVIGVKKAFELSMLAEKLSAEDAYEWGLVNAVCDDDKLMDHVMEVAQRLADGPRSLAYMRRLYWNSWQNSFETQLELEAEMQTAAGETADHKEGVQAFFEKRPAVFTGK